MKTTTLTLATILGLALTPAFAETIVEDADQSGGFSMDELKAAYPDLTEELFVLMDTDGSGEVSTDELIIARDEGVVDS